ncbi:U32 family peptidase [Roseburia sp. BX1005]|uniref:U32 family peptidase n=1 Tax=Roseburia zhanii TaxID=2763064 RepID=A0A923LNM8_9FIRM|nr:U32 family peptidase [Roseburia zhanii]
MRRLYHKNACGLCHLKQFYDMGVSSVKIVGRNDDINSIITDVRRVKHYICELENQKEYHVEKTLNCTNLYNCYY